MSTYGSKYEDPSYTTDVTINWAYNDVPGWPITASSWLNALKQSKDYYYMMNVRPDLVNLSLGE
jgi:hypothetical protein